MNKPMVRLYCGREVSSWSEAWRAECFERHAECLTLEAMLDRDSRRKRLADYGEEVAGRARAAGHFDPDAVGAEAMERVRNIVLARWEAGRKKSASAA